MSKTITRVIFDGSSAKVESANETFNDLTRGLLDSTIAKTKEMLKEAAKKGITSYSKILLVGGSTRMPQIEERLLVEFQGVTVESFDPDMSVAKGAAIYGMNIAGYNIIGGPNDEEPPNGEKTGEHEPPFKIGGGGGKPPIQINNVISKSFGVKLTINDQGTEKVVNIITKNTTLPVDKMLPAGTVVANQTSINVAVYENELSDEYVEFDMAKLLGEKPITGLPANLPKGSPVEITFKIGEEGTLNVEALEVTGNNRIFMDFQVADAMTQQQIEEAIKVMGGLRVM
jgi:molecular chaperone DnaK (HSP70)